MPPVDPWFTPKRFGYGATPVTWQGWALTCGFGVLVALAVTQVADPWRWLLVVPLASAFVALSRARTTAPPRRGAGAGAGAGATTNTNGTML